jgi:CRP/FNR family transcriptional regulator, cyclic AMP receptor protein
MPRASPEPATVAAGNGPRGAPGAALLKRTWYISGVDLFRGLARSEIDAWVAQCELRRFRAGERIIDGRSTLPEQVLVIERGAVRLLQDDPSGRPRTVDVLGPGQLFGVSCAFGATDNGLHADALTQVVVCAAEGRDFLAALARGPGIVLNLVRQVGARVVQLDGQAPPPSGRPAGLRLATVLDRLATVAGQPAPGGGLRLPACVSRATLAYQTGCTRETIARLLADLEDRRCIRREKRAIVVDPAGLRRRLSDLGAGEQVGAGPGGWPD